MEDQMTDESQFPEAELARLADGSLPESRQAELRAKAEASPELAGALAEQQRAVSLLRALDEPAPESLRARVEELTQARRAGRSARWARPFVLPAATVLAVAVAALVVLLQGGTAAPTVPQTAQFALAASTMPPPSGRGDFLSLGVDGVQFPYWQRTLGYDTAGARTDTLDGRRIVTVFYDYEAPGGARVGYAIVSGAPLSATAGTTVWRDGVHFTQRRVGSARLVTWLRSGHTCVIASRRVGYPTLLALAEADAETPAS
jgi:hypothetical protein